MTNKESTTVMRVDLSFSFVVQDGYVAFDGLSVLDSSDTNGYWRECTELLGNMGVPWGVPTEVQKVVTSR